MVQKGYWLETAPGREFQSRYIPVVPMKGVSRDFFPIDLTCGDEVYPEVFSKNELEGYIYNHPSRGRNTERLQEHLQNAERAALAGGGRKAKGIEPS